MRANYYEKILKAIVEEYSNVPDGKHMANLIVKAAILLDREANPASVMREIDNKQL